MTTLLDSLTQTITPQLTEEFAAALGLDEQQTTEGIKVAAPLLFAAVGNQVATPEGADEVLGRLQEDSEDPDGCTFRRARRLDRRTTLWRRNRKGCRLDPGYHRH